MVLYDNLDHFVKDCKEILCDYYGSRRDLSGGAAGVLEPKEVILIDAKQEFKVLSCVLDTKQHDGMKFHFVCNNEENNNTEIIMTAYRTYETMKYLK